MAGSEESLLFLRMLSEHRSAVAGNLVHLTVLKRKKSRGQTGLKGTIRMEALRYGLSGVI